MEKQRNTSATSDETDIWKELFDDTHEHRLEFRFVPSKEPGVHANLGGDSTVFDFFLADSHLVWDEVDRNCVLYVFHQHEEREQS